MVKGVSRQVIVVHAPDPKLFEQAIFILKDAAIGQEGVTDEQLLKEAKRLISLPEQRKKKSVIWPCLIWSLSGAVLTGLIWAVSALF